MSKRQAIFILPLALTLVYPLIVCCLAQAYELEWTATLEKYPEEFRSYVDFHSFIHSSLGGLAVIFGAIIAVSWLILSIYRK